MKKYLTALIFALAIVASAALLGDAYIERSQPIGTLSVTGLGELDFSSDLIVWEGQFSKQAPNLQSAYASLIEDKKKIEEYLIQNGISKEELIFNAVETNEQSRSVYNDGNYVGEEFLGYQLSQSFTIQSKQVELIETVARQVTDLLQQGVNLYSSAPRYYYTDLASLKLELVSLATQDARERAEKISENSNSQLGRVIEAKMGVFQITGQNSNEDYSWGGTFNTRDKEKTASITLKLMYAVD